MDPWGHFPGFVGYLRNFNCHCFAFSHLPPSQGGKYSGFGSTMNAPPRSASTNDFVEYGMSGLTNVRIMNS